MVEVKRIKSEIFTSNVYILRSANSLKVFLIDCGALADVVRELKSNEVVSGIFITHYHYDHIYFLKDFLLMFPDIKLYGTKITAEGIKDPKRNLSFYHEDPINVNYNSFEVLNDEQELQIFGQTGLKSITTEGHCEGSLTYIVNDYIFTGDSLIPNIPIVTKLRTGNKLLAKQSVNKIKGASTNKTIFCPGHLEIKKYDEVEWNLYLND